MLIVLVVLSLIAVHLAYVYGCKRGAYVATRELLQHESVELITLKSYVESRSEGMTERDAIVNYVVDNLLR